jgi:predicted nicotinamide N-methyase
MRQVPKLLQRIERRFALRQIELDVGGEIIPFYRVADPDKVLDDVAREADLRQRLDGRRCTDEQLHLPYWAEFWESGAALVAALAEGSITLNAQQLSVLDLGCGMGTAGAGAIVLGHHVMFADLEPEALLIAKLNGLLAVAHLAMPAHRSLGIKPRPQVRTRRVDWSKDQLGERFDLIMGADVIYDRAQWAPLEKFWLAHLAAGGMVLLAEPGRQSGDLFIDWLRGRPWSLQIDQQRIAGREQPIRLLRFSRVGEKNEGTAVKQCLL